MDFRKKRKFSFFVFCRFKKQRLEANAIPSQTTPGRGKNSSGQERRKERRKEKWWKWAEISREERQRLEGGCVTDSFRTILFYIFGNWSYFYLSLNCLLLIFFCCLICVDFFFFFAILCFLVFFLFGFFFFSLYFALFFINFGGLSLPCHLLCCLLLFVYFFYLSIYFFYLHGFSGFIFCKFNCSWHFFTSSDCVPPGGLVARGPRFGGLVSRGSKLYKWWFGKASGLINIELMNMVPRKRLTMGWKDDAWARGGVRLLLTPGWSWLDDPGDGVNCFVFF